MKWRVLLVGICACAAAAAQINPGELLKIDVPAGGQRLAYGTDALEFGELRLPKTAGPHPVVVLVHGGCWVDRLPNSDPRITTFELMRPLAAALTAAGFATWNVEYRRAGNPGGGWPGSFTDVGAAADFLRKAAGSNALDLGRVIVAGHSAGGHLAMWIAARPKLPAASAVYAKSPLPVKAVVNIDGPADLASAYPYERKFCPVAGVTQLMDGSPADHPERYREASATTFLPLGIPQKIVVGGLLARARDLADGYAAAAKAKGEGVTVLALEGSNHFDMLAPDSAHGKALLAAIIALRD